MSDSLLLLKSKDYSKLVPKHGTDHNGKPYTAWINPDKDRDQAPDRKGQQSMFDVETMEQEHAGKHRGYHDQVRTDYDEHVVKPLVDLVSKIAPPLGPRLQWKYENYIFDHETKELDLEIDYETAKYLKLSKDVPEYAKVHQAEYFENTSDIKKQINNRKKQMASKMLKMNKGAEIPLTGGRKGIMTGFNSNGFPVVQIGNDEKPIFWEEIKYPR